jgi:pyridoxamine 5'-phosphate oxidase family protein
VDADSAVERVGMIGPGLYSRIAPSVSPSWNLAGEPAGEQWYGARRTLHNL